MSHYFYSALGHSLRFPAGDFLVLYFSVNNGEWMIRENGKLYYADQYRLWSVIEDEILKEVS